MQYLLVYSGMVNTWLLGIEVGRFRLVAPFDKRYNKIQCYGWLLNSELIDKIIQQFPKHFPGGLTISQLMLRV